VVVVPRVSIALSGGKIVAATRYPPTLVVTMQQARTEVKIAFLRETIFIPINRSTCSCRDVYPPGISTDGEQVEAYSIQSIAEKVNKNMQIVSGNNEPKYAI
jgi:hypothetical protein